MIPRLDRIGLAWHDCPMTTAHANCTHPATKADRAACRKAQADGTAQALELIQVFGSGYDPTPGHWVFYAARRFARYEGSDLTEAATAVLAYFLPSGDEAKDDYRRRNGYTITTDLHTMRSITLRSAS